MTAALLRRGSDILEAAVDLFGRLAAYVCVALVLFVAANVFARYFFRAGTVWLQEFEWHLISPIALLGMSYTMLKNEQVRVDFAAHARALRCEAENVSTIAESRIYPHTHATEDRQAFHIIGNGMPDFQLGWDNTFTFGNFDLNFFWRAVVGHDLVNSYRIFYENPTIATAWNMTRTMFDNATELKESPQFSSFYVEDATFARLEGAPKLAITMMITVLL
jgi:hypothetical protein